jgi:hypothetical protein
VLANVRNNEIFCLGVFVSVDGDEGGDGYSPLGDFELELGIDTIAGGKDPMIGTGFVVGSGGREFMMGSGDPR